MVDWLFQDLPRQRPRPRNPQKRPPANLATQKKKRRRCESRCAVDVSKIDLQVWTNKSSPRSKTHSKPHMSKKNLKPKSQLYAGEGTIRCLRHFSRSPMAAVTILIILSQNLENRNLDQSCIEQDCKAGLNQQAWEICPAPDVPTMMFRSWQDHCPPTLPLLRESLDSRTPQPAAGLSPGPSPLGLSPLSDYLRRQSPEVVSQGSHWPPSLSR